MFVVFCFGDMEAKVAVIPKVENIFVHTGNIVNWNRLKGTVSQSAASEVTLSYTVYTYTYTYTEVKSILF